MRVRDRGFALILVLLAAAAVFAVVLQAAMISRAATIESRVMNDRARQEREARSAAVIVLSGLGTTVERFAAQTGQSSSATPPSSVGSPGGGGEERPRVELPAMLKEMLGEKADELEKEAQSTLNDPRLTDGGGITGRVNRERTKLNIKSLPTEPVTLRLNDQGPEYRVTLIDSAALLNVNIAERDQIIRYLSARQIEVDLAGRLASQIVDWRDEVNFAQPGGAEQDSYRERGIVCRNAEMQAIEELKYLPAVTPELYDLIRGDLTVTGDKKVHALTAPEAVLRSLPGMDDESVRAIIEARNAGRLDEESLERVLPLYARAAREHLKFTISGVLRVRVEAVGDSRAVFEGLAVVSEKGIQAVGLRPLL